MTDTPLVAITTGSDKFQALDLALDQAGFDEVLDEALGASNKLPGQFSVVIKPNFMVFLSRKDPSGHTDPELVEHLARRIQAKGIERIFVVETENVLSNWYHNRDLATVAAAAGYGSDLYELADLAEDTIPHDFGGVLGAHRIGRVWAEADFRISFAKNKTHPAARCTLALKNIFGVTPEWNKYLVYHKHMEWDQVVMDVLDSFPVHFGIIDAWWSADGAFGFRGDKSPVNTATILASRDILALDWMGATKMGLDPMDSAMIRAAVDRWGKPIFHVQGDTRPYPDWENIPFLLDKFDDLLEEVYTAHSFLTHAIMLPPDPDFPEKHAGFFDRVRKILGID